MGFVFWCCSFPLHSYLTRNIRLQTISDESLVWHCWLVPVFLNSSLPSFWSCCYDTASSWHCCSVSFISGQFFFGVPCWKNKKKSWSDTEQNNWPLTSYPFKVCWGQTIQQLLIIHQLPARWSSVRDREITPDCMLLFLIGHTLQFVHGFYKLLNRVLLSNTSHDLQCWCKLFVQVENLLRTLLLLIIWVKEEKGKTAKKENLAYLYTGDSAHI